MDGKVLLRRTQNGHWIFPNGPVEDGERLDQAAEREVEEETCPSSPSEPDAVPALRDSVTPGCFRVPAGEKSLRAKMVF